MTFFAQRTSILVFLLACVGCASASAQFNPPPIAGFVNPGTGWTPLTGNGDGTAVSFNPPPAAIYTCAASSGGVCTSWQPWTGAGGGGGTPAGPNTSCQLNGSGSFAGDITACGINTTSHITFAQLNAANRIIQNRSDVIDVMADCGAVGGANDDTTAITSCIVNNPSATILFPQQAVKTPGSCDFTITAPVIQPYTNSGQRLVGTGFGFNNGTTICQTTMNTAALVMQASGFEIDSLSIRGPEVWNGSLTPATGSFAFYAVAGSPYSAVTSGNWNNFYAGTGDGIEQRAKGTIKDSFVGGFSRDGIRGVTGAFTIQSIVVSGTTATATMQAGTVVDFVNGETPVISQTGSAPSGLMGRHTVTVSGTWPQATTFTYTVSGVSSGTYCSANCFAGGEALSTSHYENVIVQNNHRNGFDLSGSDSNASKCTNCQANINGGWGFRDNSEFGNTWEAFTANNHNDPNAATFTYALTGATNPTANEVQITINDTSDTNYPLTGNSIVISGCTGSPSLNGTYYSNYVTAAYSSPTDTITIYYNSYYSAPTSPPITGCVVGRQEGNNLWLIGSVTGGAFYSPNNTVSFPVILHHYSEVSAEPPPQYGNTTLVESTNAYPDPRYNPTNNVINATSSGTLFKAPIILPITGSTQCLHVNSAGLISGIAADCGTAITNPGVANQLGYYAATGTAISPDTFLSLANSTHVETSTEGINTGQMVVTGNLPQVIDSSYPNAASGGSIPLFLNKLNSSGQVVEATTSDTAVALFVVASASDNGATVTSNGITICGNGPSGTNANACIVHGKATLTFDSGGGTIGHYCIESTITNGTCQDSVNPSGISCAGLITQTVAGSGTGVIDTTYCQPQSVSLGGTVNTTSTANLIPIYPSTGTTVGPDTLFSDSGTLLTYTGTAGITTPYLAVTGTQSSTAFGLKLGTTYGLVVAGGALNLYTGTTNYATNVLTTTAQREPSIATYCWSSSNLNLAACDTSLWRAAANVVGISNGTTNTVGGALGAPTGGAEVVASSATPTFSTSYAVSRNVLTANVTSFTLGNGLVDGQRKVLCFKQGAGPYTIAPPANVHGFFTVGVTNADWNCQTFVYDTTDTIWLADGPGVINE